MNGSPAVLTYAACGLLIVVYASGRFNTPPSNRSSTRQTLYWWSCAGYVLSALALFAALSILLQAATWRTALLGRSDEPSLPAPLIATLAMTTLLPSIPLLKRADEWFLSIFLEWAEIPAEIKRRAAAMTRRASVSAERMWPSCAKPMATAAMATPWLGICADAAAKARSCRITA